MARAGKEREQKHVPVRTPRPGLVLPEVQGIFLRGNNLEEVHAIWYGMLNTLGIFDLPALTDIERLTRAEKRHYFWFGEVDIL